MTSFESWAVRIAEEVSPAEADLAPYWLEAFLAGGQDRDDLFQRTNAQPGAFVPGDVLPVVPIVFQALAVVAPLILAVVSSENVGKILDLVKNAATAREIMKAHSDTKAQPVGDAALSHVQLSEILASMDRECQALGLDQARCDRISLTVLRLLLENPPGAERFISRLAEKQ